MPSLLCSPFKCLTRRKDEEASRAREAPSTLAASGADFRDAVEGDDNEWAAADASETRDRAGSVYWDAMQDFEHVAAYPPITTTSAPPARRPVSLEEPDTLLRADDRILEDEEMAAETIGHAMEEQSRRMLARNRVRGLRRSTRAMRRELEKPRVVVTEKGFPGQLTPHEVEVVQRFRKELEKRDAVYNEIVRSFHDVEEEPYALCRFLRARQFDIEKAFLLLDEGKDVFKEAMKQNFYPDLEKAIGAPASVFLMTYPFVYVGNARNGCPVAYLKAGSIQTEGILCVTSIERTSSYFWHGFMHMFKNQIKAVQSSNPNIVRCECVQIQDLKGLSKSQINQTTMDVVKVANQIAACFPETLHCMIIINAPGFFSFAWKLIKKFVDPRTASKIEVYSGSKQARKRLSELIDEKHLPSDYGGTGPSLDSEIMKQGGQSSESICKEVQLLFVRKGGSCSHEFSIADNEQMTMRVYSRSGGATFSLFKQSALVKQVKIEATADDQPFSRELESSVKGPGTFRIEGKALPKSAGAYFLFVGEVSPAGQ